MDFAAQFVGEDFPAVPVAFVQAVFDGDDRVALDETCEVVHEFGRAEGFVFRRQVVFAVFVELRGGDVKGEVDLFACLVARFGDGFHDDLQRFFVGAEVRGKAAFVADAGGEAFVMQHFFQGVEDFGAGTQRFVEAVKSGGHDHEFLNVHGVVGVLATVDDVHHRYRQGVAGGVVQHFVQRFFQAGGLGVGEGEGDAEDGVGTEVFLEVVAVQVEHDFVERGEVVNGFAFECRGEFVVDVGNGFGDAFAEVTAFVAVAQLKRFARAGGRAGGDACGALGAVGEGYGYLDGRIPAGVEDFQGFYVCNGCAHHMLLFRLILRRCRVPSVVRVTVAFFPVARRSARRRGRGPGRDGFP